MFFEGDSISGYLVINVYEINANKKGVIDIMKSVVCGKLYEN